MYFKSSLPPPSPPLKISWWISFATEIGLQSVVTDLAINLLDTEAINVVCICERSVEEAEKVLEEINIEMSDVFKGFKTHDKIAVRKSNTYYVMYREDRSVENLAWSSDRILNTCEERLRNTIREGLVSVSPLQVECMLVLKNMLDSIMDVDDSAIQVLN